MDELSKEKITEIDTDMDIDNFFPELIKFLHQSLSNEKSQKISGYQKKFKGLDVKISFGKGNFSVVPWICFLKEGEDIQDGYYPGFYFDRELSKLFVVLGVSEANIPTHTWPDELIKDHKKFGELGVSENVQQRFPSTFLYSQYDIDKKDIDNSLESQKGQLFADLNQLIGYYQKTGSIRKYWQIAPNAQAQAWDYCIKNRIIPIYFNEYLKNVTQDVLNYSLTQLTEFCQKNNPNATTGQIDTNVESIWNFLHDVKIDDYVLTNKGKSVALGWGIIKSDAKIFKNGEDITFYRDVDWKETKLNRDLRQTRLGNNFFKTIYQMTKEHFESIVNMTPIPTNPMYLKILRILDYKKQVILYGPPGTGKTFYANGFINTTQSLPYQIEEKSLLDQRIFSLTTYSPKYENIPTLELGKSFTYEWKGKKNWQCYFDELQEGDTAIVYHATLHKYTTVVRCIRKDDTALEFSVLYQFDGVSFEKMKADTILGSSDLARVGMSFSLKRLNEVELRRIIELSEGLSYASLGVKVNKIEEAVENKKFVTFHPSYGYEDFVEGLRPVTNEEGSLNYRVQEGIFKEFSRQAFNVLLHKTGIDKEWTDKSGIPSLTDTEKENILKNATSVPFFLIIDEINRGDISRIFGELITLIEADKRSCEKNELVITLPYSKQKFAVPPNLMIIGTMNTADKSIALVDIALRRRFGFIEMMPDYQCLEEIISTSNVDVQNISTIAVSLLERINQKIYSNFDRDHQIGHSYFTKLKDVTTRDEAIKILHFAWYYEILPLLQEYYYDSPKKLLEVVGDKFVSLDNHKRRFQFTPTLEGDSFLDAIKEVTENKTNPDA